MVEMAKFARRDTADFPDVENGVVSFLAALKILCVQNLKVNY
jgi:hypothetical protein